MTARNCGSPGTAITKLDGTSVATRRRHLPNVLTCFGEIDRCQLRTKSVVNTSSRKTSDRACANRCVLCPGYLDTPMRGRFTGATPEGRAKVVAEEPAERMDKPK